MRSIETHFLSYKPNVYTEKSKMRSCHIEFAPNRHATQIINTPINAKRGAPPRAPLFNVMDTPETANFIN